MIRRDITGYEYKANEKSMELAKLMNEGTVTEVPAIAFNRRVERKPKESFIAYKRSMRNMKRAMKAYFKGGPGTVVLINKDTMVVVK
jgi:hypothetical protein